MSKLPLLAHCQAWANPVTRIFHDPPGPAARLGTELGRRATAVIHGQPVPRLQADVDAVRLQRKWRHLLRWLDENRTDSWKSELALAYNPETGTARMLGIDIGREYEQHGAVPHEVCGAADVFAVDGTCVDVYDFKSGRRADKYWPQLHGLGLAAARFASDVFGVPFIARTFVVHCEDNGVTVLHDPDRDVLRDMELAATEHRIREQVRAIETGTPSPGWHCDAHYCAARLGCGPYMTWRVAGAA